MNILELPDSLLLEIFSYLNFKGRARCSGVCQRWYNIANDLRFKKVFHISGHTSIYQLQKLIKYHGTPNLKSLTVRGGNENMLSSSVFNILKENCPNLQILSLSGYSINTLDFNNLPNSLTHLSLSDCFPRRQLISYSNSHLKCLDLTYVHTFTSQDVRLLNSFTSLRCLFLSHCSRINDGGIEEIKDILPQLRVLDLEYTDISNRGVTRVLDIGVSLKALYIGNNKLTDKCILDCKKTANSQLEELCIEETCIQGSTEAKNRLIALSKTSMNFQFNKSKSHALYTTSPHYVTSFGHRYHHKCS